MLYTNCIYIHCILWARRVSILPTPCNVWCYMFPISCIIGSSRGNAIRMVFFGRDSIGGLGMLLNFTDLLIPLEHYHFHFSSFSELNQWVFVPIVASTQWIPIKCIYLSMLVCILNTGFLQTLYICMTCSLYKRNHINCILKNSVKCVSKKQTNHFDRQFLNGLKWLVGITQEQKRNVHSYLWCLGN